MSQQQKLADIASLRLTQYLVRLPDKEEPVSGAVKKVKVAAVPEIDKDLNKKGEDGDMEEEGSEEDEEGEDEMEESAEDEHDDD